MDESTAEIVLNIISDDVKKLDDLYEDYKNKTTAKQRIRLNFHLINFLTDGILSHSQQIVSFYILYKTSSTDTIENHPLRNDFLYLIKNSGSLQNMLCPRLYEILCCYFNLSNIEIGDKCAKEIMSCDFVVDFTPKIDIEFNKSMHNRFSPTVIELTNNQCKSGVDIISHDELILRLLQSNIYGNDLDIQMLRPTPDEPQLYERELEQTYIVNDIPFLFDRNISDDINIQNEDLINSLFDKLQTQCLDADEESLLFSAIKNKNDYVKNNHLKGFIQYGPDLLGTLLPYVKNTLYNDIRGLISKSLISEANSYLIICAVKQNIISLGDVCNMVRYHVDKSTDSNDLKPGLALLTCILHDRLYDQNKNYNNQMKELISSLESKNITVPDVFFSYVSC